MACSLVAPSFYLNQFTLPRLRERLWHSYESNFTASALGARLCNEFECYTFKNIATFLEYNAIIWY